MTIFSGIKKRWEVYEEKQRWKQFEDGYNYAIGAMARGEKTPIVLESESWRGLDRDEFDFGVDRAIIDAVDLRIVDDDRI